MRSSQKKKSLNRFKNFNSGKLINKLADSTALTNYSSLYTAQPSLKNLPAENNH